MKTFVKLPVLSVSSLANCHLHKEADLIVTVQANEHVAHAAHTQKSVATNIPNFQQA